MDSFSCTRPLRGALDMACIIALAGNRKQRSSDRRRKALGAIGVRGCASTRAFLLQKERQRSQVSRVNLIRSIPLYQVNTRGLRTDKAYALHKDMMNVDRET